MVESWNSTPPSQLNASPMNSPVTPSTVPAISSHPLLHSEELVAGESYHLLPIRPQRGGILRDYSDQKSAFSSPLCMPPYRMSCDKHGNWRIAQADEVPKHNSAGVWKVKLVIISERLREILSQESKTFQKQY
ncbi:hypothetical protein MRB53_025749 [Persea americana]|uniref:Uncharacterized protein n=1 Tax=Persea americana TaxID=3435 RepID=A0ACC2LH26_PERAE|nr:hypothetical protein MRB53_025749 [Persea americana]